ncbi:MAG TPA: hypothetical protein VMZ71_12355, partial [Gemmataceae bacterium]|nr:hypothetical protein [Gemmataceae bacterium]
MPILETVKWGRTRRDVRCARRRVVLVRPGGRLRVGGYFSESRSLGQEPIDQPVMAVYRIDTDDTIHRIIADAGKPKGVAVSPDPKTLDVVCDDNDTTGIGRLDDQKEPTKKGAMTL